MTLKDRLSGWDEIANYLGVHPRTAQRYVESRGLKVRHFPGDGSKGPVYAYKTDLDAWLAKDDTSLEVGAAPTQGQGDRGLATGVSDVVAPILERLGKVAHDIKLYRRNYVLRFHMMRAVREVKVKMECEFELHNASNEALPFVQEVTVDDSDRGFVEKMSFSVNGKPVYLLQRPSPTQKFIGYALYCGPQQSIKPSTTGVKYSCDSSWVIRRSENDIWYNHMVLPTVGVEIHTKGPPEYEITPSFSIPGLVMKAEHLDVAWNRRR